MVLVCVTHLQASSVVVTSLLQPSSVVVVSSLLSPSLRNFLIRCGQNAVAGCEPETAGCEPYAIAVRKIFYALRTVLVAYIRSIFSDILPCVLERLFGPSAALLHPLAAEAV